MTNAATIARALRGARNGAGYLVRCPVLTHGKGKGDRDPSLSIRDGDEQLLVRCFAGCEPADIVAELARRGLIESRRGVAAKNASNQYLKEGVQIQTPSSIVEADEQSERERIRCALALWAEALDPTNTVVEKYLADRGVSAGEAGHHAIRFHPALHYNGTTVPGMVALYRDITTDRPTGIHRTFFDREGRKLSRKMLGRTRGAAIKLSADELVTERLGIAEGIETTLAVIGLGWRPVWATGSAPSILRFPVLAGVEALTIFADHDQPGLKAARACGQRWANACREARILKPPGIGADWNDVRAA